MSDPLLSGFIHHLSTTQNTRLLMKETIPKTNADDYCQRLKPKEKAYYIRDSQVKGLVLRVKPTGSKSWIFCYTVPCHKRKWRERKKGLGCFRDGRNDAGNITVTVARREAERLKNDVRHNGADPVEDKRRRAAEAIREQASRVLVKDLFEQWASIDLVNRKDKGAEARRMMLKDVIPFIGELNVKEVRKGDITKITDKLLQRGVNRMAKVIFSLIRQMFRFAVTRDLLEVDPTAAISKTTIGGANVERERVLNEDEIQQLATQLSSTNLAETIQLGIWLILGTCCRIGELFKARWSQVDLNRKFWVIPSENSKNDRELIIYLSPFTFSLFKKLHTITGGGEWCFPASRRKHDPICPKTVTRQITDRQRSHPDKSNRTKNNAALNLSRGLWRPHDLRRTGATMMTALGVLPEVAERCLNHLEENRVKRIYQRHTYEVEMKEAWEKLGNHLESLTRKGLQNGI
jgi:integrase